METKFEIVKNAFDTKNFNTISFRSFAYKHAFGLLDFRKRGEFEMLKQKYIFDPSTVKGDLDIINPLSLEPQNPWNIQQEYEDLRNTIKMDVDRIFPDIPKFQDPVVKEIIGNVLFVWALENSTISYRQGMHEIGSIVFLVIERDMISPSNHTHKSNSHQDFNHVANNVELQREMVVNICDTRYLEHDTYILFSALMEKMGVLYEKAVDGQESAIILRCRLFFNDYLKTVDYELYRYMMLLNIEPQLFGMRWLRLLFAREVDLEKVLKIWDALIFRSSSDSLSVLDTIDWIAVSLLVSMRTKLLAKDYSECLQVLMKYPQDYNVVLIVSSAAELKTKYSSPKLPEPLQTSNITDSRDSGHEYVNSTLSKILKEMKILEPHVSSQMGKGMLRKMHYDLDKVIGILESEFHKKSSPAKTPIFRQLSATDLSSPLHSISQTAEVVGGQIISSLSGFSKAVGKVIDESRHSVSAGSQPRSQQLFHVSSSSSSRPPTSKSMQSVFQTDNIDDGSTKKLEKNSSSKSLNQIGDADPLSSSIYPPP